MVEDQFIDIRVINTETGFILEVDGIDMPDRAQLHDICQRLNRVIMPAIPRGTHLRYVVSPSEPFRLKLDIAPYLIPQKISTGVVNAAHFWLYYTLRETEYLEITLHGIAIPFTMNPN